MLLVICIQFLDTHGTELHNRVKCLDNSIRYKKRPNGTMNVIINMAILSVDAISSSRMDMSCDIYLMQEWFDERCFWKPVPSKFTL